MSGPDTLAPGPLAPGPLAPDTLGRGKYLRARAHVLRAVRAFFERRDFLEVETPSLVPCPGLDVHLDAVETNERSAARYLITSPEYQMKRLLVEGYPRIFQLARCFRRGELGAQHNPEFTMLEWYRANAGVGDVMTDTEELVTEITGGTVRLGEREVRIAPPFRRLSVREAFETFAGVGEDEMLAWARHDEDRFFRVWVETVDPRIAALGEAVLVVDYPAEHASLARRRPDDPRYAERFELYVAGVELCNGFGELVDPVEQRARFVHDRDERRRRGLPVYPLDEAFLADLARGMPPSGGNAVGLDRLVALACGFTTIRPVLAFAADEV